MSHDFNKPPAIGEKYVKTKIKDGKVSVEAFGFNGEGCQQATRGLEEKLGTVASRTLKEGHAGELQRSS